MIMLWKTTAFMSNFYMFAKMRELGHELKLHNEYLKLLQLSLLF